MTFAPFRKFTLISAFLGLAWCSAAPAATLCAWDLSKSSSAEVQNKSVVWEAAVRLERCDIVGLTGLPSQNWLDAVQLELSAMGETWLQTAPRADAPGKSFLWKASNVSFSGNVTSYPANGGGLSGRFLTSDGEPFAVGLSTPIGSVRQGNDLRGFVSHLKHAYPEAPGRWVLVTSDVALGDGAVRADVLSGAVDLTEGVMTADYKEVIAPANIDGGERSAKPVTKDRVVILGPVGGRLVIGARGPAAIPAHSQAALGDQNVVVIDIGAPALDGGSAKPKAVPHFVADTLTGMVVASTCRHASLVPNARALRYASLEDAVSRGYQRMSCDDFGVMRDQLAAKR